MQHAAYQGKACLFNQFRPTIVMQQVCSHVPKKKKEVLILSFMYMSGEVKETQSAKLEIITYYYKTKGGVDTINAG